MTAMPDGFDPRADVVGVLDLCNINTPDGDFGFMPGTDGKFTDVNGKEWLGSTILTISRLQSAIDGVAPSGSVGMSFFQDPDQPDLIAEIKRLGIEYVDGRPITFYWQPIRTPEEFYAPTTPPVQWLQRTMRTLSFRANGALDRSVTLGFESWSEDRKAARRIILNTDGHAKLIGAANPSLEFMPTVDFEEEKLFG
jgi:hypothetical protein